MSADSGILRMRATQSQFFLTSYLNLDPFICNVNSRIAIRCDITDDIMLTELPTLNPPRLGLFNNILL